jgi:Ion channel
MDLSQARVAVLLPMAVGTSLTFCTIVIHAFAVTAIVYYLRRERRLGRAGSGFWRDLNIVVQITSLALVAHIVEAAAWALAFVLCGQFSDLADALYHSAENYTTLGYGDVVMSPSWRLLGPLEAADGMLMFGVSTAVLFAVIQRLVQARFADSNS